MGGDQVSHLRTEVWCVRSRGLAVMAVDVFYEVPGGRRTRETGVVCLPVPGDSTHGDIHHGYLGSTSIWNYEVTKLTG